MFLGVQVVSIAVMLCIIVRFSVLRKLPTLSTIWYQGFLYGAIINFTLEMFSLLTLYEKLPVKWNLLSHRLFFASLVGVLHLFFLFIDIKIRNQKRYSLLEFSVRTIPLVITALVLVFGEVEYHVDNMVRYSHGSMVTGISLIAGSPNSPQFFLSFYLIRT